MVDGQSHYWNRFSDGLEVDLTREQFETFEPTDISTRTPEYVLSYPDTQRRYRLLRDALAAVLP